MCGRTSLGIELGDLEERFGAKLARGLNFEARYNIAPGEDLAAIQSEDADEIDLLEWGFGPQWADDPDEVPNPINARSETVAEKPMFRDAYANRRCLVLADGFYEWKGDRGHKQPYRIERPDREPYAYAGLYETWTTGDDDGDADDGGTGVGGDGVAGNGVGEPGNGAGDTRVTCTILTTDANDVVSPIHDRMPCILQPGDETTWLHESDPDALASVLEPYPSSDLHAYPVTKRVNDPTYDAPDLLDAVDVPTQTGLDDYAS
jgi:putative SOS response-associated peptidase YedK